MKASNILKHVQTHEPKGVSPPPQTGAHINCTKIFALFTFVHHCYYYYFYYYIQLLFLLFIFY